MTKKAVSTKKEKIISTDQDITKIESQEVIFTSNINNTEQHSVEAFSLLTDFDISLFRAGKHFRLYEKLGSHVVQNHGVTGTLFAVWAPNAKYVSVIGEFNGWNRAEHPLNDPFTTRACRAAVRSAEAMVAEYAGQG